MLFKNKRTETRGKDRLAGFLASAFVRTQREIAGAVNKRLFSLNKRGKMVFLCCVTLCFGSLSFLAIISSFDQEKQLIKPSPIAVPKYLEGEPQRNIPPITPGDISRINQFKNYLDSLRRDPKGRFGYDSLLRHRPHLLDSLALIETFYHSQLK